jgi:hypothetical protein
MLLILTIIIAKPEDVPFYGNFSWYDTDTIGTFHGR